MKIMVMSDLHLSRKPWQVRKAFRLCKDADMVLLVGDLVNDGTQAQLQRMQLQIAELLPDIPVLAVAGNHDYPVNPLPFVRTDICDDSEKPDSSVGTNNCDDSEKQTSSVGAYICDYPDLQDWLLGRQSYPYEQDGSGAWAVRAGNIEIIGLNAATHWRRFKFPGGLQLDWLAEHLEKSDAAWHVILCHAPLMSHNPVRSSGAAYLSRDKQLRQILDAHRNIIFISGHLHASMNCARSCLEWEEERNNIYINDGSIRPTMRMCADGKPAGESDDGNLVELVISDEGVRITGISVEDGSSIKAMGVSVKE